MNKFHRVVQSSIGKELERVVEPLASYVCASDQPKTALMSALAILVREVEATNRVATAHFRSFSVN